MPLKLKSDCKPRKNLTQYILYLKYHWDLKSCSRQILLLKKSYLNERFICSKKRDFVYGNRNWNCHFKLLKQNVNK